MYAITCLNAAESVEAVLLDALSRPGITLFEYRHQQTFIPGAPELRLLVVTLGSDATGEVAVMSDTEPARQYFSGNPMRPDARHWLKRRGVACFPVSEPWCLAPIAIAKPWGRELWFTGMEARGESAFMDRDGFQTPLSWLLALMPRTLLGQRQPSLTLLKILDPLPEPVFGDLYFEMHEQKQEVYVVTRVDANAWPGGQGGIRFGFDQQLRRQYGSDEAFRSAYLDAVRRYESIRRTIDEQIDGLRRRDGVGVNEPVSADQQKAWLAQIPSALERQESEARAHMDRFAHVLPLQVGDVVKVPCYTPHSLMHGVTTVEFQTPVYERKILSFAQKVLTQAHWDTADALGKISLDAPVNPPLVCVHKADGVLAEQVVRFDDFSVMRIRLDAGACHHLDGEDYALLMVVAGSAVVENLSLHAGQAYFMPAASPSLTVINQGLSPLVLLLSSPL